MKKVIPLAKQLLVCIVFAAVLVCSLPALYSQAAKTYPNIKSISIKNGKKTVTKKTISLTEGEKTTLKVVVKPAKAKKSVSFKSAKPAVAAVSSKGKITAKKAGTSKVTVTVRGKNGKKKTSYVKMKVKAKEKPQEKPQIVAVESVTANISKSQLTVGETAKITANVLPANATDQSLTYASTNESVVSVSQSGDVTAKGAGTAGIKVTASNGKYAEVSVTVKEKVIDVESVTAEIAPTAALLPGNTAQITVNVLPANATDKRLTYTSSDEAVVTVDQTGKVTAKATGKATVKIAAKNGKSTEIEVTVIEKYEIDINDYTITDGNDSIYGKLYAPKQEGTWPTVILSHGYRCDNTWFEKDCKLFAENGYIAYAYDFCGGSDWSKSSGETTDMTIFTEQENLHAVFENIKTMDGVDSERIYLLGGSMGGLVTALEAEVLKEQVKGVILYFPAFCVADDWRKTYPTVDEIPEVTDFLGTKLGKEFFTSIHEFNPYTVIGGYSNPVLIIWGTQDNIVSQSYVERAKEKYSDAKLIILPDRGHDPSDPEFRNNALAFMEGK